MKTDAISAIADAVLYEGYALYPYRPSSVKNRQRWTFGGVFPRSFSLQSGSDPWALQAECLAQGEPTLSVRVRFLQLVAREILAFDPAAGDEADDDAWRPVAALQVGGRQFAAWEEAVEREVEAPDLALAALTDSPQRVDFAFAETRDHELLRDDGGALAGAVVRSGHALAGALEISAARTAPQRWRLTIRVENHTRLKEAEGERRALAQRGAFASTHLILNVAGGEFLSLADPPEAAAAEAAACVNEGLWPVLVGAEGARDAILASPIILYDYPQIAPESPGELFDGTEIDEILTLRILTMTDAEKAEAAAADPRVRALLERTEALTADQMARMHGALRSPRGFAKPILASLAPGGARLAVGDRVRLNPRAGGDIMDIVLAGKIAIVEAIERDFEDRTHVAVVIEDDPGRDMGLDRFPGHRFFFSAEELTPVERGAAP
jgi:hydrogenase maturation protease